MDTKQTNLGANSLMAISDNEFARFKKFVYSHFGINLTDEKRTLVVGRMQKYLRQNNFLDFSQYLNWIEKNPTPDALSELINRISTNHTFFFRENDHFNYMKSTALPEIDKIMHKENTNDLRVWCAAAATGEEPYTLATVLKEYYGINYNKLDAGLLATDISVKALESAQAGIFASERLDKTPENIKRKYFKQQADGTYMVSPELKKEVTYRRFNLMNEVFPFKKKFHIIFCRNVMIYFDKKTRDTLAQKLYDCTAPGGYLFIGHSETLGRDECPYEYVMPAVYRKRSN